MIKFLSLKIKIKTFNDSKNHRKYSPVFDSLWSLSKNNLIFALNIMFCCITAPF